jgi:hypothetical protein
MGYRDFGRFNKALLAKQGWQQPTSFLSQIMEAKYYRGGNFLESKLGNHPSFTWQSIHSSCELLKEGFIWRVGNGTGVCIWKDKWLPRPSTFMVHSLARVLNPNALVSKLIDVETIWWDTDLINTLFTEEEVQGILSLPISVTDQGDVQVWRGTKNGNFSMKSACYIQKELKDKGKAETSMKKKRNKVWREIWGLKLRNQEKNFMWCAATSDVWSMGDKRLQK